MIYIPPEPYDHWLSTLDSDPRELLMPFSAAAMKMWPISTRVNKPGMMIRDTGAAEVQDVPSLL
jgi:putative SOS response-associated peptidase YedK